MNATDLARSRSWRTAGAVLAVLLLAGTVHAAVMLQGYTRRVAPELRLNLATTGRSLAGQIDTALDHGVPLQKLFGMEDFLAAVLRDSPDLAYVAILSGAGELLHAAGPRLAEARPMLAGGGAVVGDETYTRRGNVIQVGLPLRSAGRTVGSLVVATEVDHVWSVPRHLLAAFAGLFAAAAVVAGVMTRLLLRRRLDRPLARLGAVLEAGAAGRFPLRTGAAGKDAVGRLAETVDGLLAGLRESHARARGELDELRQGQIDKTVLEDMAVLAARLEALPIAHDLAGQDARGTGRCC